jgi:hypothetical protein
LLVCDINDELLFWGVSAIEPPRDDSTRRSPPASGIFSVPGTVSDDGSNHHRIREEVRS